MLVLFADSTCFDTGMASGLFWSTLVTVLAVLTVYFLFNLFSNNKRRPPTAFPIISTFQYGTDPAAFLLRCQRRMGDVFTVWLANTRFIFVMSPLNVSILMKEKNVTFETVTAKIMHAGFGQSIDTVGKLDQLLNPQYPKYLQGSELEKLIPVAHTKFKACVEKLRMQHPQSFVSNLWQLTTRIAFEQAVRVLYGDKFYYDGLLEEFNMFDDQFQLLVQGLPAFLTKKSRSARNRLLKMFSTFLPDEDASQMVRQRILLLKKYPELERTGFHNAGSINLAFLWATAANTVPGLFFTIYYIIRFREAYQAVCNEMEELSRRRPNWLHSLNRAALDELVVLDSVVREVLRLISSAMILREAANDFTFTTADGHEYDIRKGERLTITSTALHLDERIYPNPRSFMYNRFMKSDDPDIQNQRIRSFFDGKPLLMQNIFLPFGSGSHLCPGRHLALIEIKQFVLFLLNDFDVELVDPSASIPKFDHSRYGLGNLPPALNDRDIDARFTQKVNVELKNVIDCI